MTSHPSCRCCDRFEISRPYDQDDGQHGAYQRLAGPMVIWIRFIPCADTGKACGKTAAWLPPSTICSAQGGKTICRTRKRRSPGSPICAGVYGCAEPQARFGAQQPRLEELDWHFASLGQIAANDPFRSGHIATSIENLIADLHRSCNRGSR